MELEEEGMTSTQVNKTAKKTVDAMDPAVLKRKVIFVVAANWSASTCFSIGLQVMPDEFK